VTLKLPANYTLKGDKADVLEQAKIMIRIKLLLLLSYMTVHLIGCGSTRPKHLVGVFKDRGTYETKELKLNRDSTFILKSNAGGVRASSGTWKLKEAKISLAVSYDNTKITDVLTCLYCLDTIVEVDFINYNRLLLDSRIYKKVKE